MADAVREAGATLVAYSPLAQGLLTGVQPSFEIPLFYTTLLLGGSTCSCDLGFVQILVESVICSEESIQCDKHANLVGAAEIFLDGWVTGKYNKDNLPKGPRGVTITADRVAEVEPLLSLMRDIGSAHSGKTPGQVRFHP